MVYVSALCLTHTANYMSFSSFIGGFAREVPYARPITNGTRLCVVLQVRHSIVQ